MAAEQANYDEQLNDMLRRLIMVAEMLVTKNEADQTDSDSSLAGQGKSPKTRRQSVDV